MKTIELIAEGFSLAAVIVHTPLSAEEYKELYGLLPGVARNHPLLAKRWKVYAVLAGEDWAALAVGVKPAGKLMRWNGPFPRQICAAALHWSHD